MAGDPETQPTQPANAAPPQDPDHVATLIPVVYSYKYEESEPPAPYELRQGSQKVVIGRGKGSQCDIKVADDRCSRQHLQISWDVDGFFVQQLGGNGSWINDNRLHKGETRALCHGDQISLVNPPHTSIEGDENKAFAVFVFRETSRQEALPAASKRRRICPEEVPVPDVLGLGPCPESQQ